MTPDAHGLSLDAHGAKGIAAVRQFRATRLIGRRPPLGTAANRSTPVIQLCWRGAPTHGHLRRARSFAANSEARAKRTAINTYRQGSGVCVRLGLLAATVAIVLLVTRLMFGVSAPPEGASALRLHGIHKIRHVIVIMQENRSFDSYFGTYPGADGLPKHACIPDPPHHNCARPYVDHADSNAGGPHSNNHSFADVNGGKMNGFVKEAEIFFCASGSACNTDV